MKRQLQDSLSKHMQFCVAITVLFDLESQHTRELAVISQEGPKSQVPGFLKRVMPEQRGLSPTGIAVSTLRDHPE